MTVANVISPVTATNPTVEIRETLTEIIVTAQVPQIDPENLEIKVGSGSILLWGEQMERVHIEGYCDFSYPALQFHKIISLPHPIQTESIKVDFKATTLTMILAKADAIDERELSMVSGLAHPELV
jgi:HSP20 family protein